MWQWLRHGVKLDGGSVLTTQNFSKTLSCSINLHALQWKQLPTKGQCRPYNTNLLEI